MEFSEVNSTVIEEPEHVNGDSGNSSPYKDILGLLRKGLFDQAQAQSLVLQRNDFEDTQLQTLRMCALFWKERWQEAEQIDSEMARAHFLYEEWLGFVGRFIKKLKNPMEQIIFSIRYAIFSECLRLYEMAGPENAEDVYHLQLGKFRKGLGEYDSAIKELETALKLNREKAEVWAELADCYDMIGNTKYAKLFFREAFFLDPQKIDLEFLESEMIARVRKEMSHLEYDEKETKEWIPVYAVLFGLFTVKRELKPLELGKIKQSIYSLRSELQNSFAQASLLKPRLINRYFWLIDHYLSVQEDRSRIDEMLLNIKLLDPVIHEKYNK